MRCKIYVELVPRGKDNKKSTESLISEVTTDTDIFGGMYSKLVICVSRPKNASFSSECEFSDRGTDQHMAPRSASEKVRPKKSYFSSAYE
jgi:hypothetical protein